MSSLLRSGRDMVLVLKSSSSTPSAKQSSVMHMKEMRMKVSSSPVCWRPPPIHNALRFNKEIPSQSLSGPRLHRFSLCKIKNDYSTVTTVSEAWHLQAVLQDLIQSLLLPFAFVSPAFRNRIQSPQEAAIDGWVGRLIKAEALKPPRAPLLKRAIQLVEDTDHGIVMSKAIYPSWWLLTAVPARAMTWWDKALKNRLPVWEWMWKASDFDLTEPWNRFFSISALTALCSKAPSGFSS